MNKAMIFYILGFILLIEGAFMLLPILVAVIYREQAITAFLITAAAALVAGFLLRAKKPAKTTLYAKDGFVIVALSWIVLSLVGAIPFTISHEIPSYLDAVFETVSGFTTTGASILTDVEALSHCMLFWRSFTHWLGGMGVLVFVLTILPTTGGESIHLLRAESPGPSVSKMVPRMKDTAKILYGIYLALTVIQFLFYLAGGMPVFDGLCLCFGTAGTGGFGVLNTSLNSYGYYLQTVTTVFMILFGVNFSVYYFILRRKWGLVTHNLELRWYLAIIFAAIGMISLANAVQGGLFDSVYDNIHHTAFTVGSIITTTGFGTADYTAWPIFSRVILVLLMIIGASAGSTGGGLKVSRVVILFKSVALELRRVIQPNSVQVIRVDGKRVPRETVTGVKTYLIIYALITVFSVLLVSLDNFDPSTTLTSVIATFNNIGPGMGVIGTTGNYAAFSALSKIVLTLDMLFGRLEILPMMILLLPSTWKKR